MTRMHWFAATLTVALLSGPAFAQSTSQTPRDHGADASPAQQTGMMGQDHQRMMAEMKLATVRLQELVLKMNATTGDQKVSAMADLLTQLVTDQANMHRRMMDMHDQMMGQAHK